MKETLPGGGSVSLEGVPLKNAIIRKSFSTNLPVNLLDVNMGTSWATAIGMPQYIVIDFEDALLFDD